MILMIRLRLIITRTPFWIAENEEINTTNPVNNPPPLMPTKAELCTLYIVY